MLVAEQVVHAKNADDGPESCRHLYEETKPSGSYDFEASIFTTSETLVVSGPAAATGGRFMAVGLTVTVNVSFVHPARSSTTSNSNLYTPWLRLCAYVLLIDGFSIHPPPGL